MPSHSISYSLGLPKALQATQSPEHNARCLPFLDPEMHPKLVLVDYENVHKVDLSLLDDSYSAIIYVGAKQNPPKAAKKPATAHRFTRVDFQKIEGSGKNALDFHIAFQLGRIIETAPKTECFVLSKDKGFDPLVAHLNKNGLKCSRVNCVEELLPAPQLESQLKLETHPHDQLHVESQVLAQVQAPANDQCVCRRCKRATTIEHHGGRWCPNCGCFTEPADPTRLPSNQPGYRAPKRSDDYSGAIIGQCGWCYQKKDMSGGIYDDGEWMCADCIGRYTD